MARPLVTIVTPSFNQAAFLEDALRSVADQDYPRIEHIVMDGGSTDGSLEIIEAHKSDLAWWESGPDGGQAAALNKAFARSNGEILGWLNSDDVLLPGAISAVVDVLEEHRESLLVFGNNVAVDEHLEPLADLDGQELDLVTMIRRCRNWVVQPGSLFRRRAFEIGGPFETASFYYFDFEFVLRLLIAGGETRHLDRSLALYRIHSQSKTGGDTLVKAYDHLRLYDAIFAHADLPRVVRDVEREARARSAFTAAEFFLVAGKRGDARRSLLHGVWLSPRAVSRWVARLAAQAFLPHRVVDALPYFKVVG